MKIILDECLPKKLKNCFKNNHVTTVTEQGWAGKKNGELLSLVESSFDVFITVDRNLSFQQNLCSTDLIIIVLHCSNNRYDALKPIVVKALENLSSYKRGSVVNVK